MSQLALAVADTSARDLDQCRFDFGRFFDQFSRAFQQDHVEAGPDLKCQDLYKQFDGQAGYIALFEGGYRGIDFSVLFNQHEQVLVERINVQGV